MMATTEPGAGSFSAARPSADEEAGARPAAAVREGIFDVAYRTLDTPVGSLLLAATGQGLICVVYPGQGHDAALSHLAERVGPRILHAPGRLDAVARQLEEYFGHTRTRFDVPVDLRLAAGFRRRVLEYLPFIPYGSTESYRQVAAAVGSPRAVRAVASGCAANPVPIVVPCHRVIRSDGTCGGYVGGPEAKRALLALEAA